MLTKKQLKRSIAFTFILLGLSIGNFSRLSGLENIRAIHIVSLIVIGILAGVCIVNIIMFFKSKKEE